MAITRIKVQKPRFVEKEPEYFKGPKIAQNTKRRFFKASITASSGKSCCCYLK